MNMKLEKPDGQYCVEELGEKLRDISVKYYELIYAVGNKYPNESRHQTALRYIQEAEKSSGPSEEQTAKYDANRT